MRGEWSAAPLALARALASGLLSARQYDERQQRQRREGEADRQEAEHRIAATASFTITNVLPQMAATAKSSDARSAASLA